MSKAEEVRKLLDSGHTVVLRKNGMGSYLAVAVKDGTDASVALGTAVDKCLGWDDEGLNWDGLEGGCFEENMEGVVDTDDFNIADLLYRITEKATTGRIA